MSFADAFTAALQLLFTLDPRVLAAAAVSLRVSLTAAVLATVCGVPIGFAVAAPSSWV